MKIFTAKRALLSAVLSLVLCVSLLMGTTFAWFTDSVTSQNNKIVAGTLQMDLELLENGSWTSIKNSGKAIFDYDKWEPGYTAVQVLRVTNKGTLALKWYAKFVSQNELSELADVIDVYVNTSATVLPSDRSLDGYTKVGTVREFVNTIETTTNGALEAGETAYLGIGLKMRETAGNEYQGLDLGGAFDIQILATQFTSETESDTFDNQYDAAAPWTGKIPTETPKSLVIDAGEDVKDQKGTITIKSPEAFAYLNTLAETWVEKFSNGQGTNVTCYRESEGGKGTDYYYHWQWKVMLDADLDMSNIPMDTVSISYWGSFDGNGHTISNVVMKDGETSLFDQGTIKNVKVNTIAVNAPSAKTVGAVLSGRGDLTNVHVVNANISGGKYVGGLAGKCASITNCSVKNSTITGTDKTVGGLAGYSIGDPNPTAVRGNTVENVTVTGAYNVGGLLGQSQNETVENNTVKNVTVKSTTEKPADASSNEVRTAEVAARSDFANTTIGSNTVEDVTIVTVESASDVTGLAEALEKDNAVEVVLSEGTYTLPNGSLNAGDTILCEEGVVFEGAKLNINGATVVGATFSDTPSSNTVNGTYKDCTFTGSNGLRYGYAGDIVVFENCTFSGNLYGVHFDGGTNEVIFKNCTFSGFNAMGAAVTKLTMEGCTFVSNGKSGYNGINMWGDTDMINCTFVFDGSCTYEWIDLCSADKTATFTNCVVKDGTTTSNVSTLIGDKLTKRHDSGKILCDGVELTY